MGYEYKCVGAPERPKRQRGVRGRSDRVALAMQEIIQAEAIDGWEYLRTDLVPVEEKPGFFSRPHEVHRAVLVFRRELEPAPRLLPARRGEAAARDVTAGFDPAPQPSPGASAGPSAGPPTRPSAEPRAEGRIPLSAERDEPPAPGRGGRDEPPAPGRGGRDEPEPARRGNRRPPSGLG